MAPFDASDDLEVSLSKSQEVHVDVSKCNAVSFGILYVL